MKANREFNQMRDRIQARYGLSEYQRRRITRQLVVQLSNCKDEESCRVILGVGGSDGRKENGK